MKNHFKQSVLKLAVVSVFALGSSVSGVNSYAATATANATATVLAPIAIATVNDLRFGSFSTSASGQTVTIAGTSAGTRTNSGTLLASSTTGSASFTVTGTGSATYAITLSGTVTIITLDGTPAAETMAVSSFTSSPSGTGTLTAGAQTLYVGATLTTVASQVAGAYTGTFDTIVEYN